MTKRLWMTLLVAVMMLAAAGCSDDSTSDASKDADAENAAGEGEGQVEGPLDGPVLVFAAASLTDAFGEVKTAFEAAYPGVDVQLNFAGSSALREQILEGAPADVFASANESNMTEVVDAGDTAADPDVFVTNRLQIAVPAGNPGDVAGLSDFAKEDLLIGLCAEEVPCGDFGREALSNAGVEPSIDTNEPDVRSLLTKVGADELDAGIVYITDVTAAGNRVEGIDIPDAANVTAAYPIAELADAPNPDGAAAFIEFVQGQDGQTILADYGFGAP